jgi:hypothetical protein
MKKFMCACCLMLAACLVAGLYGMIHNQISYTVAPEYFTQFKFDQFSIPASQRNRWGASLVGWQAAWWMGIVIGSILIPLGLIIPGWQQYLRTMGQTFLVVMLTTLAVGLGALAYAYATFTLTPLMLDRYPARITQPLAFARAGHMHNFSYLGGLVGIIAGIVFLLVQRRRIKRRSTQPDASKRT